MWLAPVLLGGTVALPVNTPIPCLVCRAAPGSALTFAGTVKLVRLDRLDVFDGKTRQTMGFIVPAEFHGVESSDGKIKDAPVTRATPGLLARVTYQIVGGYRQAMRVVLLTIDQCRELMAAEKLSNTRSECPD